MGLETGREERVLVSVQVSFLHRCTEGSPLDFVRKRVKTIGKLKLHSNNGLIKAEMNQMGGFRSLNRSCPIFITCQTKFGLGKAGNQDALLA